MRRAVFSRFVLYSFLGGLAALTLRYLADACFATVAIL